MRGRMIPIRNAPKMGWIPIALVMYAESKSKMRMRAISSCFE